VYERVSSLGASILAEPACVTNGSSLLARGEMEQSIPARFERQVRLYPERIAVADAESALTYRELNALANRIVHKLLLNRE